MEELRAVIVRKVGGIGVPQGFCIGMKRERDQVVDGLDRIELYTGLVQDIETLIGLVQRQ